MGKGEVWSVIKSVAVKLNLLVLSLSVPRQTHVQPYCSPADLCVLIAHSKQERVDKGIETDGSNLSGVSAKCAWDDLSRPPEDEDDSRSICIGSQPRRLSDKGEEF